jgi:hypothetical protein
MNDCETIILDELKEIKKDVKALTVDVAGLKMKSAIWGIIGGAIFTILIAIIPLIWHKIDSPKVTATTVQDTTWKIK